MTEEKTIILFFNHTRLKKTENNTDKDFMWDFDGYERDMPIFEEVIE
jgi:hypothetical protein